MQNILNLDILFQLQVPIHIFLNNKTTDTEFPALLEKEK